MPFPTSGSNQIFPPKDSTILLQVAKPIQVPITFFKVS